MTPFITVEKGMNGWYLLLADLCGPIERLENWDYQDPELAREEGQKLAREWNVKFV